VLVENGYQNTVTTGRAGSVSASYPQSLVRIGTFDPHFDVEFSPPSVTTSSAGGTTVAGASDIGIGAKYELGYSAKASWGISGVVTIPTGTPAFSAGAAQYTGDFNWGYTLSPAVGLTGTVSFNAFSARDAAGQAQPYFALIPSVVVTTTLPVVPGYGYAEYVYYSRTGPTAGAKSLVDFGYEVDIGTNLQLDLEYGVSPTSIGGSTQHYTGAGLSFMY
jgi:hypothetical protein